MLWPVGATRIDRLSGIFSFFCEGSLHNNGTVARILEVSEGSLGETFSIRFDDGNGSFPSQGLNTFQLAYNNGNRVTATTQCLGTDSELYDHRIGMSFDGARGQTYANGALLSDFASTLSLTADTINTSDRRVRMFAKESTSASASLGGRASMVLVWNRPMSLAMYRALWANPDVLWDDGAIEVYGVAAGGGGVTSSFAGWTGFAASNADSKAGFSSASAKVGAIATDAATKSTSAGLTAIAGAIGTISDRKAATAGISAISGLLGALSTTTPGTAEFHAIAGALVNITHATARIATIQAKAGTTGQAAAIHKATRSLQAIAGAVGSVTKAAAEAHSSAFAGIAGAAAALSVRTARIAATAARLGLLGTDTAKTIRQAETAAIAGLRVAVVGINGEDIGTLLTVAVSARAAYGCTASSQVAYNCTVNEAIAA